MGTRTFRVRVDERGHLALPPEVMAGLGLVDGASVRVEEHGDTISLGRSTASLGRVYVEPTNACNLHCRTCVRNVWDEPAGMMSVDTFARVIDGVRSVQPLPTVFFGGFGEPFAHRDILAMVAAAKATGAPVELITNGTALDVAASIELIRLGLDRLWVSLDGATPDSYADVRLRDAFPQVTGSLARLRELRIRSGSVTPRLGIAFVAMRSNVADLPEVIRLGAKLGADRFSISNVLPHTPEMRDQVLYGDTVYPSDREAFGWARSVALPRMMLDEDTSAALARLRGVRHLPWPLHDGPGPAANTCPFVERGSVSIRWDGRVSPCLPLLHTHRGYLDFRPRVSHAHLVGDLAERSLAEIWNDQGYVALRERLQAFDFSPCTECNSCDMADENLEDCFGSPTPACGGCLWAQGFIRCP
ncbi:MAG: SPASM domain-containing protein [Chloroflexi bacterium]|nr:SPASM domain-containing protein [Chloroflexota bacterium]